VRDDRISGLLKRALKKDKSSESDRSSEEGQEL
jgi:hypothetical protein